MGKYTWDEQKYKRYLKEGRGQGEGSIYKPWINVQDFPSKGWSTKTPGWKTKRMYQFMSDVELMYFYLLEWADIVTDIREQFPLLDLEETERIAEELGIKHPIDRKTGFPRVLTTDFLITAVVNGKKINIARTVKQFSELDKKRVIEKFEIERRYWTARNIDWGIVTEKEILLTVAKNVEWLHDARELELDSQYNQQDLLNIVSVLKENLLESGKPIHKVLRDLDTEMNMSKGTSLYLLKYLIAHKQILVDMTRKLEIGKIVIKSPAAEEEYGVSAS